jgi:CubicO group peptidase (beta-lactamase class C family)
MQTAGVPGVGLCVVQGGRVVAEVYRGVADAGDGRPVSVDTLWVGASLSKPLFAFAPGGL